MYSSFKKLRNGRVVHVNFHRLERTLVCTADDTSENDIMWWSNSSGKLLILSSPPSCSFENLAFFSVISANMCTQLSTSLRACRRYIFFYKERLWYYVYFSKKKFIFLSSLQGVQFEMLPGGWFIWASKCFELLCIGYKDGLEFS